MRTLFVLLVFTLSLFSSECVLILTKNASMAKRFAHAFEKYGLKSKMIAQLPPEVNINDLETAKRVAEKSICSYALYMPIEMRSSNLSGDATFEGDITLYTRSQGSFEQIHWRSQKQADLIDTFDHDFKEKVLERFVSLSVQEAMRYFKP
ncbi:MAG: hypothetical protein JXK05_08165 [Campylobacterales bacterium]|nr:hypothetical protein [Campylobacterales bacterium]